MSAFLNNRVAALVPVLNEAPILAAFLEGLRDQGIAEIVVADGGSIDGSLEIARGLADKTVNCAPGRGMQIAHAARHASADIYWILHCDSIPPTDAAAEITKMLAQKGMVMGAFPIVFDSDHPLLRCYSYLSRFDSCLSTFGDQGFFLRAEDYHRIGGMPEIPLFEDVELRRRVCRYGRIAKSEKQMTTSARRFLKRGVIRQQVVNGMLLARYFAGAHPERLAQSYYHANIN